MPLDDELLAQGNPAPPSRGIDPILGSPDSNPMSLIPTGMTSFIDSKERLEGMGGPSLEDWLKPKPTGKRVGSTMVGLDEIIANKRYKYYEPGADNEEIAALGQSSWEKWSNALYKMGAIGLGIFAQGFMTIPDTISAIKSGKLSDLYKSDVESGIDKWLKNMEDNMPNYYSNWEKEHPFASALPFSGGFANFWGDKVVKNLGFMAGAIGSAVVQDAIIGGLTGGLGDIPLVSAQVGKAALWLNKIMGATDDVAELGKIGASLGKASQQLFNVERLGQIAKGHKVYDQMRYGLNLYGSARTEAAIEAREGHGRMVEELTADFVKKNGYQPFGEDAKRIENFATSSANVRFGVNMALLTVSDAIQFEGLLKTFNSGRRATTKLASGDAIRIAGIDSVEKVAATGKLGAIWNKIQPVAKNIVSEGFYEEGGQYAAGEGSYEYYKSKYNGDITGSLDDIMNATVKGLGAQFGTEQGLESMFIGAITGGLMGGGSRILNGKKIDQQTQAVLSVLNSKTLTGTMRQQYADTAKSAEIKKDMEEAVANGDIFGYKNLQHDNFFNFIQSADKAGRFDVRLEQINMLKELDQKEFEQMFGMEFNDSNRVTSGVFVDALIQKAKDVKLSLDAVNNTFNNPFKQINSPKTEEEIEENESFHEFEEWKVELANWASMRKDSDNRISSMQGQMAAIAPALSTNVVESLTSRKGRAELLDSYTVQAEYLKNLEPTSDPVIKAQRSNELKEYTTAIQVLKKLIDGINPNSYIKEAADLMTFEANRNGAPIQGIPQEQVAEILTLGNDINQLRDRKRAASEKYDALASAKGLEGFIKHKRELEEKAIEEPSTEAPKDAKFFNKEGKEENVKIGKKYQAKTSSYRVVNDTNGKFKIVDENGKTVKVRETKEGADQDAKILNDASSGMASLTVETINPDGTIKVKDANGKYVDISADELKGYERIISAEEKLLEDKALQADIEAEQSKLQAGSGNVNTPDPDPKKDLDGSAKKPIAYIASTTDPSMDTEPGEIPERTRHWIFLNNFKYFNTPEKYKVITVHAGNEAGLGLAGLTKYKFPNATAEELANPDTAPIFAVYIIANGANMSFVNEQGVIIGEVGKPIDINKIVYSSLSNTETTNSFGEKYVQKEGDLGSIQDYQTEWRERRKELLSQKGDRTFISGFNISRGIALENKPDGKQERNSVVGTLITQNEIETHNLIEVNTTGTVVHQGVPIPFPVGKPVLKYKDTLKFLNNRNLSKDEVNTIYNVLREMAARFEKTGKLDKQGLAYLQGVMYWFLPKDTTTKPVGRNQAWIKEGYLHLGPDFKIPFSKESLETAGVQVVDHLATLYNNVNNAKVKPENILTPFEEIVGVNPDGSYKTITWKNYQTYLLSPIYVLDKGDTSGLEGKQRDNLPLSTSVRKKVSPEDYNFVAKYSVLTDLELKVKSTVAPKKEAAPKKTTAPAVILPQGKQPAQQSAPMPSVTQNNTTGDEVVKEGTRGGVVFDGKTPNLAKMSTGEQWYYTASVDNDGNISVIVDKQHPYFEKSANFLMDTARGILGAVYNMPDPTYQKYDDERAAIILMDKFSESLAKTAYKQSPTETKIQEAPKVVQETTQATVKADVPATTPKATIVTDAEAVSVPTVIQGTSRADALLNSPDEELDDADDNSAYRTAVEGNIKAIEKENFSLLEAWMHKNLPQVPVKYVRELIRTTSGGYAWGVFRDGAIYIYDNAEVGTLYHEAFHAVWRMFLNDGQRASIRKEFLSRSGNSNLSPIQVEEGLAEEFRSYVQNGKAPAKTPQNFIVKFFNDLIAWIKNVVFNKPNAEQLFSKINSGHFAGAPVNLRSVNLANPAYSIAKMFNEKVSREILEGVSARLMQNLFAEGNTLVQLEEKTFNTANLYDAVYEEFRKVYEVRMKADTKKMIEADPKSTDLIKANYEQYLVVWDDIKANWELITKANNKFLRTFGLVNEENTDGSQSTQEEDINNEDREGRGDGHLRDVMKIDGKKNASTAVKLLFATLIETEREQGVSVGVSAPRPSLSSIGQFKLVKYGAAFNHVMHNISNTNNLEDMIKKLSKLAGDHPNYVRLFSRLGGDLKTGTINYNDLSLDQWQLLIQFFNVFAKQKPKALVQIVDEGGKSYTVNANFGNATRDLVEEWVGKMRMKSSDEDSLIYYSKEDKAYELDQEKVKLIPIRTLQNQLDFLKALGINITTEQYSRASRELKDDFTKAVSSMLMMLKKDNRIMSVQGKTLGITGSLNTLAEFFVRTNGDTSESTFYNSNRERVQTFVQNNYPSMFVNDFNAVKSLEELYMTMPQLTDNWSRDSVLLQKGGRFFKENGERTDVPLTIGYIDGTLDIVKGRGKQTSKLSLAERRQQEINQNLSGRYYILAPADSQTEWLLESGNFIQFSEMYGSAVSTKVYNHFRTNLETEILNAQISARRQGIKNLNKRAVELRFFKNILNAKQVAEIQNLINDYASPEEVAAYLETNKADIDKAVNAFINKEANATREYLEKFNIIQSTEEGYTWRSLDDNFVNDVNNNLDKVLDNNDINRILQFRTINYFVSNIEMHKVFFGDPALIKDPTKRIKSFLSGTETNVHNSDALNASLNIKLNVGLQPGDIGYHHFKDHMKTVTAKDVLVDGGLYGDREINEADAQTWMKDTTYREFMWKHGRWKNHHEIQFQYEMAWTRNHLGKPIEGDAAILEKGNPGTAIFQILKPKGSGMKLNDAFIDPYLDKTSAAPLFLRHITMNGTKNTNLGKLWNTMQNEGIGYVIVESGRKIGAEALRPLYNADGTFNDSPVEENTVVNIPFRNIGIQQETSGTGKKQTLGSQLTKLVTMDLLNGGMPIDFKGGWDKWNELSEKDRIKASSIYEKVKRNQSLLEEMAQDGYERLLRKLGIEDTDQGFRILDKKKLESFLHDELFRREMDENAMIGVELNLETGDFNCPLEANPKYIQIKNILYSIVDKQIASPKVNGGAKIQMSAAMWEEGGRETSKAKLKTSKLLKFYTKEDPYMEIMVPHWFAHRLRAAGFKGTDAELIEKLKDSKILRGIGFRIPTQKLSSIDAFRIVGFLPQEMGDTVVVPAELTAKTGSDFDVDKLNTYLKNIEIDKKGNFSMVEYKGDRKKTIDFYTKKFNKLLEEKKKNAADFFEAIQYTLHEIGDVAVFERMSKVLDRVMDDNSEAEAMKSLERLDEKTQKALREAYVNRMYTQSLENAYFDSLEELVTLPENFERLTSPNDSSTLKDLRDELRELTLSDEELERTSAENNHSLLLSPSYMSETRHNFMIGKGGVGIAAIQQTNHSLNQRAPIYINTDVLNTVQGIDRIFLGDGVIRLPHNKITVNGKEFASLSGILDTAGKYISDKISAYIDGYVDISKDAFIVELGATPNAASIFMFMEKIGVPTEDVIMFMNQPVVREFLSELSIKGWSSVVNGQIDSIMRDKFSSTEYSPLKENEELKTTNFKDNIRKYYKNKEELTAVEKAEQLQILDEFLKYAVMANHLGEVIQGSNYDTANFNDPNLLTFKWHQTQNAKEGNIVSSVGTILNNSFVGKRARWMFKAREAIGQAIPIKLEQGYLRAMLDVIRRVFSQKGTFVSEKDKLRIARGIETSFIDYLVQTHLKLNGRLEDLLLDAEKGVAKELEVLKEKMTERQYAHLQDNIIFQELVAAPSERAGGPKNVRLKTRDNDAHTSNMYTGALRELRDNIWTEKFYGRLIRLSLLQSGVRQTPSSFGHLIPIEDYRRLLVPIFEKLDTLPVEGGLDNFMYNNAFFRNYWKDDVVVPRIKPVYFEQEDYNGVPSFMFIDGEMIFQYTSPIYYSVPARIRKLSKSRQEFISLSSKYNSKEIKSPLVKVERMGIDPKTNFEYTPKQIALMKKAGNYSYKDVTVYAKVLNPDGSVLQYPNIDKETKQPDGTFSVIYKHVNAWGDGQNAQEYHENGRPSIFDNGATKNPAEIDDLLISNAFYNNVGTFAPRPKLTQEEVKLAIEEQVEKAEVVASSPIIEEIQAPSLAMQPDNIEKIKAGKKTITNRTEKFEEGIYQLPDGTKVELKYQGVGKIDVLQGSYQDEQTPEIDLKINGKSRDLNKFAQAEGFENWKDFTLNNKYSRSFIEGNSTRHIYSISLVDKKSEVPKEEVKEEKPKIEELNVKVGDRVVVDGERGVWIVSNTDFVTLRDGYVEVVKKLGDSESLDVAPQDLEVLEDDVEVAESDFVVTPAEVSQNVSSSLFQKIENYWINTGYIDLDEQDFNNIIATGTLSLDEKEELDNYIKSFYREPYNPNQFSMFDDEVINRLVKAGIIKKDC